MVALSGGVEPEKETASGGPAPGQECDRLIGGRRATRIGPALEFTQAIAQLRDIDGVVVDKVCFDFEANLAREIFADFNQSLIVRPAFRAA